MPRLKPNHVDPTPEEDEEINRQIAEDPDDFELDDEWFARAKPMTDVMPVLAEYWRITQAMKHLPPVRDPQNPDAVYPPGVLLKAELEIRNMSRRQLAEAMQRPVGAVHEIIRCKKAITPRTALDLERALEIPAHVWMRLETDYRIHKERQKEREVVAR